jgi:gas vesicle protein
MSNNGFQNGNGGSFVLGLLAGAALGAGLGMLFAPKSGSELRSKISEQAGSLASKAIDRATETYKRATGAAAEWAEKRQA